MKRLTRSALLIAATLALPGTLLAAGEDSQQTPTCKKGEIYDQKSGKCVKQQGAVITDGNRAIYAYSLAKAERYEEALAILDTVADQSRPDVLNYRGYATRKLGRVEEGIGYYLQSVKADPGYALVREYLGEAYLMQGRKDLAEQQLKAIEGICGTGCEPYEDLSEALSAAKG